MTLQTLQRLVYRTQKDHFPPNDNRDQKLLLITGEIVEAQNGLRNGHRPDEIYYSGESTWSDQLGTSVLKPEGYPIELADALIRILNLMSDEGFDAQHLILLKDTYNQARPYMHGKAF